MCTQKRENYLVKKNFSISLTIPKIWWIVALVMVLNSQIWKMVFFNYATHFFPQSSVIQILSSLDSVRSIKGIHNSSVSCSHVIRKNGALSSSFSLGNYRVLLKYSQAGFSVKNFCQKFLRTYLALRLFGTQKLEQKK